MKFLFKICVLVLGLMFCMSNVVASSDSGKIIRQKQEIRDKTAITLDKLYNEKLSARRIIQNCEGYAVFFNTGIKTGIIGSSHGRGMAVNNRTGEEVFMKMGEYAAGFGFGIKEYAMIFVFGTQDAYYKFVNSGWKCNAEIGVGVDDGVNGGSIEGATCVGTEIWVYQITTRGLMASVDLKGTEYYRNKKLSPK